MKAGWLGGGVSGYSRTAPLFAVSSGAGTRSGGCSFCMVRSFSGVLSRLDVCEEAFALNSAPEGRD